MSKNTKVVKLNYKNKSLNDLNKVVKKADYIGDFKKKAKAIQDIKTLKGDTSDYQKFDVDWITSKYSSTFDFLVDLLNNLQKGQKYLLQVNNTFYTLTDGNVKKLLKSLTNQLSGAYVDYDKSDGEVFLNIQDLHTLILHKLHEKKEDGNLFQQRAKNGGEFFKHFHNTKIDLTKYQIYTKEEFEKLHEIDQCLIYALRKDGLEESEIEKLVVVVKNRNIPRCEINKLCDIVKIKIFVTQRQPCGQIERKTYGEQYKRVFRLGLVDDHYFINEKSNVTSFCIKNYDLVKDKQDCNHYENTIKKNKSKCINSFDLVELLLKTDGMLTDINLNNSNIASKNLYAKVINEFKNLEYDEDLCTLEAWDSKPRKDKKYKTNVFFDVETNPNGVHECYLVRYIYTDVNNKIIEKEFIGKYCVNNMLQSLTFDCRLIAHFAGYDYRFLIRHLYGVKELNNCGNFISACGFFKNFNTNQTYEVEVKDSYRLITSPLVDFSKMFNLGKIEKEVMPYNFYTEENIEERFCHITKFTMGMTDNEKVRVLDNSLKWGCISPNSLIDIIKYSSEYCKIDCLLLMQGYNIFRQWIIDDIKIDIDNILTSASLAHQYLVNEGCYDGIYKLSNVPQLFIQGCVVGGRVMCANNKKNIVYDKINDYDAVSLYPSAMARILGFLKGKPKVLKTLVYDEIKKYDGYFVDIKIKSVGVNRSFPLMSYKDDNGRHFINEMVDKVVRVDKTTLEDFIEYHKITFEIIQGYYFDEGFNNKINEVITFLFNKRVELKKVNNSAEMIYKLIMNSGYGKSLTKPVESKLIIFDNVDKYNMHIRRNYNWIEEVTHIYNNDNTKVVKWKVKEVNAINEHFNICHVGCSILSMSKRIMNEVMCLAEDNNIDIFYQDTDSMHLKNADISTLENLFSVKYCKKLEGKGMGQFHSDFSLEGTTKVVSIGAVFLGKKSYIDKLEGTDTNGNKKTGYHIRMKGIPNKAIHHNVDINYINPFDMYLDLYEGEEVMFDLTCSGTKTTFKRNKDYTMETLDIFNRRVSF